MQCVNNIRLKLLKLYRSNTLTENGTLELVGESFIADEPAVFGTVNEDYVRRELNWYNSESRNVHDIEIPVPKLWLKVCGSDGLVNSNYGWCIYSSENGDQYKSVLSTLLKDKHSRQGMMIYTRPSMHVDATSFGKKDFICTNTVQALIRNNKLDLVVNMRSNDAVYGYKNDLAWQKNVQKLLVQELKQTYESLEEGTIYWQTGSFHVYQHHFYLLGN